jgi:hypothetical protein
MAATTSSSGRSCRGVRRSASREARKPCSQRAGRGRNSGETPHGERSAKLCPAGRPDFSYTKDPGPWRRLASAVLISAMRAWERGIKPCMGKDSLRRQLLDEARCFLEGDMEPWASVLNLAPETDLSFRRWCRAHGLVAGRRI